MLKIHLRPLALTLLTVILLCCPGQTENLEDGFYAVVQFEDFTRQYLGKPVAIVVGGEVVTAHGIKAVIRGRKIQISRCGDAGCEILFRELKDNIDTK